MSIGYNSSQSKGDGRRGKHCGAIGRLWDETSGGEERVWDGLKLRAGEKSDADDEGGRGAGKGSS